MRTPFVMTMRLLGALLLVHGLATSAAAEAPSAPGVREALDRAGELLQAAKPREALAALRPARELEPDNPWLWFYHGLASARLGNYYDALESYDRALDRLAELGDPDPDLRALLRRNRRRARREVLRFEARIGFAYDTNVSYLGDAGNQADIVAGESDGKFSSGVEAWYAPIATSENHLSFGARLGHAWHFDIDEFDYQDYGGSVRYARRIADEVELALRYDYDFELLGNQSFLSQHLLTPSVSYLWSGGSPLFRPERTSLYYQFAAQDFRYEVESEFDRDGVVHALGLEQRFSFRLVPQAPKPGELTLGYRLASNSTRGSEFDQTRNDFYVGVAVPVLNPLEPSRYLLLPDRELLFRFGASWELADYWQKSVQDRRFQHRDDYIKTFGFSLSQTLLDDPDAGEITLHGIIHWTDARSNVVLPETFAQPYTYDKVLYGLQLEWAW